MFVRNGLLLGFLFCAAAWSQKPEYEFYTEFRSRIGPSIRSGEPSISEDKLLRKYSALLRGQGVAESEILRRIGLLQSDRNKLESDYWNRYYLDEGSRFNREPNAFLVEVVGGRKPGVALDYAMGEGRNSIYLASLGWEVHGFDPADAAVAMAQRRAGSLGLKLVASAARDSEYDFGTGRFDLILFSWSMPLVPVEKVVQALRPGGIVVMECAAHFVGKNGMLKLFDSLRIVKYEILRTTADFDNRMETEVLRLIAVKPE